MNRQNTRRDAHWEICKICRCERCKCLHHSDWIATFHSLGAASSCLKCNVSNSILFIYIYIHLEEILWRYFKLHAVKYRNKKNICNWNPVFSGRLGDWDNGNVCSGNAQSLKQKFRMEKAFSHSTLNFNKTKKKRCYF